MIFQWDDKNIEHIARHRVAPPVAEQIVRKAMSPFPRQGEGDKLVVWGSTETGRYLQVIYVIKDPKDVAVASLSMDDRAELSEGSEREVIRVIHAMDLTDSMRKQYHRLRRRR